MVATTDHVLPLPKTSLVTRSVQLATAVAVLGLAAYGITYLSFDAIDLTLFSALATIIITIYVIVASTALPAAYNYWAILGLDIFAIVFWLISFSYLAYDVASVKIVTYSYSRGCAFIYDGYCYKNKRGLDIAKRSTTTIYTYRNAMAAAAGLGGLEFVLFVKTLVYTSIYLHRHRKAGGHCMPSNPNAPVAVQQQPAPVQQTQPVYQPQQPVQQVYQQQVPQPVYQQQVPQQIYQQPQPQPTYQPQQQHQQTYQQVTY